MTQADSVHSRPPTSTSASNPPDGPQSPQDSLYLKTPIAPRKSSRPSGDSARKPETRLTGLSVSRQHRELHGDRLGSQGWQHAWMA